MPKPSPRGSRGYRERKVGIREPINRFLIVCEGEKTEPNYFRKFRVPKDVVSIEIHGIGYNTTSLVEQAIMLRQTRGYTEDGDQVWCVFDRDSTRKAQFNDAVARAEAAGLRVAYSNQAFELWYLLHFGYYDTALHRKQYYLKLTEQMGRPYRKNDEDIYDLLAIAQDAAIRNAERLHRSHAGATPADANPCTTVYQLVEELRKFMSPYK